MGGLRGDSQLDPDQEPLTVLVISVGVAELLGDRGWGHFYSKNWKARSPLVTFSRYGWRLLLYSKKR